MSNLSIKHGENHTNISSISLHSLDWTRWEILLTNSLHSRTAGYSSVNNWYFWLLWRISFGVFIGDFMKELFEFLYSRWRYPKINLPNVYIWLACSSDLAFEFDQATANWELKLSRRQGLGTTLSELRLSDSINSVISKNKHSFQKIRRETTSKNKLKQKSCSRKLLYKTNLWIVLWIVITEL